MRSKISAAEQVPGEGCCSPLLPSRPTAPSHLPWRHQRPHSPHVFPPLSATIREARVLVPVDHVEICLSPVLPESWRACKVEKLRRITLPSHLQHLPIAHALPTKFITLHVRLVHAPPGVSCLCKTPGPSSFSLRCPSVSMNTLPIVGTCIKIISLVVPRISFILGI